jgi:hypothetical protein
MPEAEYLQINISFMVGDSWSQWNQMKRYLIEVYELLRPKTSPP